MRADSPERPDGVLAYPLVPLTSSQLTLLRPDGTSPRNYDNVVAVRFAPHTAVSPADFRRALEHAVRAQAGYRLRFGAMTARFSDSGRPVLVDFLAAGDAGDVLTTLEDYPFDLRDGPLVCCSYAVADGTVRGFAVAVPHIVLDGTSQALLLDSLAAALTGRDVQTCDEAQYLRHISTAIAVEERALVSYRGRWDAVLGQWAADRAQLGWSPPSAQGHRRPERAVHRLAPELAGALRSGARQRGMSELDFVLAAYGAWLTECTGSSMHPVRLIVSVREQGASPFAGCLVNTVPLVLDTTAGHTDLVAAAAERKRRALTRRFVTYTDVCQRLLQRDQEAVDLLERSTMVTYRRIHDLTGARGERLADVDYTLPPAWPRAPVLLRILSSRKDLVIDVETGHRLPEALHAGRIAGGLTGRLADLVGATARGKR
jgi:hypothetical protein